MTNAMPISFFNGVGYLETRTSKGLCRGCEENMGNIRKLQVHFYLKLNNGTGQKLHRNIKVHAKLIVFNFYFPESEKP